MDSVARDAEKNHAEKPTIEGAAVRYPASAGRLGQWVILTMFSLAIGAAAFAWIWRKTQTDDCLAFWGSDGAEAIRTGEKITLLRLVPARSDEASDLTLPSGKRWHAAATVDLSQAKGITHARRALIEDSGFDWSQGVIAREPDRLDFAIRFQRGNDRPVTVGLDLEGNLFHHVESGKSLTAHEKLVSGWKDYANRHAR